jgi:hypothetical protein
MIAQNTMLGPSNSVLKTHFLKPTFSLFSHLFLRLQTAVFQWVPAPNFVPILASLSLLAGYSHQSYVNHEVCRFTICQLSHIRQPSEVYVSYCKFHFQIWFTFFHLCRATSTKYATRVRIWLEPAVADYSIAWGGHMKTMAMNKKCAVTERNKYNSSYIMLYGLVTSVHTCFVHCISKSEITPSSLPSILHLRYLL